MMMITIMIMTIVSIIMSLIIIMSMIKIRVMIIIIMPSLETGLNNICQEGRIRNMHIVY